MTFQMDHAAQKALRSSLNMLFITTLAIGILIPITVAFIVSRSHMWKKPVFIANAFALAMGFVVGGLNINYLHDWFSGQPQTPRGVVATSLLVFFISIAIQFVLFIRLLAVYPPRSLDLKTCALVYGPFLLIIVARLVNAAINMWQMILEVDAKTIPVEALPQAFWDLPYPRVEWFLQLCGDTYASVLFLLRLKRARAFRESRGVLSTVLADGSMSYSARLRTLFWIATFNFVCPVILNVVLIFFSFLDHSQMHGAYVLYINAYLEIVCVLLATIFCLGTNWDSAASASPAGAMPITFADLASGTESQTTEKRRSEGGVGE